MALTHPIFIPLYSAASQPLSILKIAGSGTSVIEGDELVQNYTLTSEYVRNAVVWDGNIYFPFGAVGVSQGWLEFNPRTNKFHYANFIETARQMIPMGGYIAQLSYSYYQRGSSIRCTDTAGGALVAGFRYDWARLGDTIHVVHGTANYGTYVWAYPFTGVPAYAANPQFLFCQRLCAYKGVMYGLNIATGTSYLYAYSGGWTRVGTGFALPEAGDVNLTAASTAFFEAAGKLWFVVSYNTPGTATQWHRLFEVDAAAGTVTEQDGLVPAGWKVVPIHTYRRVFEVIDDTGTSRLVYLFGSSTSAGGWDCYEFDGTNPMTLVANGGHTLGLNAGAIWDEDAQGCHVISGADSIPSSYSTIVHKVSDIKNNNPVTIDLRYQDLSDVGDFPVHEACTEKLGVSSEGKTGLISKPASISTIADLSDNFADDTIDPILWERVNIGHRESTRDYAAGYCAATMWYNLTEQGGSIRLGGTNPAPSVATYSGVGLKSRWGINGAFTIQATLSNLADLLTNASRHYKMIFMVKTSTNNGFGVYIWRNTNVLAMGFYLKPSMVPTVSAIGSTVLADGMIMQIGRDASGNITCLSDIATANENITPTLPPLYSNEVQLWIGAFNENGANWTGSVLGPGFSNITVAGAGTIGKFEGSVNHNFMWDHIADMGVNKNTGVVIHADTN